MSTAPLNPLVEKVRAKYPGAYDDMDDATLTKKLLAKYPQYSDLAAPPAPKPSVDMQEDPMTPGQSQMAGGADSLTKLGDAAARGVLAFGNQLYESSAPHIAQQIYKQIKGQPNELDKVPQNAMLTFLGFGGAGPEMEAASAAKAATTTAKAATATEEAASAVKPTVRGALPPGQYEAPASTLRPPKQLGSGVIEGEYVDSPTPAAKRPIGNLPAGVYEQGGGFEPNQPALPAKQAIQLPASTPNRPQRVGIDSEALPWNSVKNTVAPPETAVTHKPISAPPNAGEALERQVTQTKPTPKPGKATPDEFLQAPITPSTQNIRENSAMVKQAEQIKPTKGYGSADSIDDRAVNQEWMQNLQNHGESAEEGARREFAAGSTSGVTKQDLTGAPDKPVVLTKTKSASGKGYVAGKLPWVKESPPPSAPDEDLTGILQKSLDQAKAAKAGGAAKQPWEMTDQEVFNAAMDSPENAEWMRKIKEAGGAKSWQHHWEAPKEARILSGKREQWMSTQMAAHDAAVKEAVASGKPVPAEVLKDFPELQQSVEQAKAAKAAGAKTGAVQEVLAKKLPVGGGLDDNSPMIYRDALGNPQPNATLYAPLSSRGPAPNTYFESAAASDAPTLKFPYSTTDVSNIVKQLKEQGWDAVVRQDMGGNPRIDLTHRETAAALDAQSAPARNVALNGRATFVRFGKIPPGGRSYNGADQFSEAGTSVFRAKRLNGHTVILPSTSQEIGSLLSLTDRPVYELSGDVIGIGSDGEPLLKNATAKRIHDKISFGKLQ